MNRKSAFFSQVSLLLQGSKSALLGVGVRHSTFFSSRDVLCLSSGSLSPAPPAAGCNPGRAISTLSRVRCLSAIQSRRGSWCSDPFAADISAAYVHCNLDPSMCNCLYPGTHSGSSGRISSWLCLDSLPPCCLYGLQFFRLFTVFLQHPTA